jgi:hypothetical protein
MAEQDELRLTITAVDQASPVLKELSGQIAAISGGAAKNNLDVFRQTTAQAHLQFRSFGEDIKKASDQIIPPFARGIGGVATAFVGLAFATDRAIRGLQDYAKAATNMAAAAERVGTTTAQYRGMVELLERSGVSADAAESSVAGLARQWGELQKQGSQFAEMIAAKGGMPGDRETIQWVQHLREAHLSVEEVGNAVKERGDQIYEAYRQRMLRLHPENIEGARTAAANVRDTWLRAWESPELFRARQKFVTRTPEEIAAQAARDSAAGKYLEVTESIAQHWDHILEMWKTDVFNSPLMKGLKWVDDFLAKWEAKKEEEAAKPPEAKQPTIRYPAGARPPRVPTELEKKGVEQSIEDYLAAHKYEPPVVLPRGGTAPPGGTGAAGKPRTIPHYQEGGFVDYDQIAQVHAGEIIHPREGADAMKEQTKQTRELSEQMKRLNDWLQIGGVAGAGAGPGGGASTAPYTGAGGVMRMGGLPSGYGAGPMARMYGGFSYGGTGPAASYPGRPGGESGGYGGPGGTSGGTSDPAVPGDILETAKHAALTGGPGAVDAFMRSQGYPKSGNWCGEFAASVVKAASGTPPKNPAIASNWRNWGLPDPTPHPGDIAVANRGVPTGATGSHVTFVESVDPKTGRFTGLGGNQGRGPESSFNIGEYTFRRSVGGKAGLPNGSDVGPGTGAGAGQTPAGMAQNAYLAEQRGKFGMELRDPKTRALFEDAIAHEANTVEERQAVAEAAMNRAAFRGISLRQDLASGFWGPVNRGAVTGNISGVNLDASQQAIARVLKGSNIVHGATDQGMPSEIHSPWREVHGDTYGDISPRAADWRKRQQLEAMTHKVEGSGTIDVNVNAPRGTFVKAAGRGMFKSTRINRQVQMEKSASSVPYEE